MFDPLLPSYCLSFSFTVSLFRTIIPSVCLPSCRALFVSLSLSRSFFTFLYRLRSLSLHLPLQIRLLVLIALSSLLAIRMPYVLVAVEATLACGPTTVGDAASPPAVMEALGATLTHQFGNALYVSVRGASTLERKGRH